MYFLHLDTPVAALSHVFPSDHPSLPGSFLFRHFEVRALPLIRYILFFAITLVRYPSSSSSLSTFLLPLFCQYCYRLKDVFHLSTVCSCIHYTGSAECSWNSCREFKSGKFCIQRSLCDHRKQRTSLCMDLCTFPLLPDSSAYRSG